MIIKKQDIICILILLAVTLVTRLLLVADSPIMYAQDAYYYVDQAMDFALSGKIQFGPRMPFVVSLGVFLWIFGPVFGEILASRLFMIVVFSLLVLVTFSLGLRISGRTLGFLAALMLVFEPISLSYSTVPYSDIFAVTMGLMSFYFATSHKKQRYFLSPIFFYFAAFTRPELYLSLVIPVSILYFYRSTRGETGNDIRTRILISLVFVITVYVLPPLILVSQYALYFGSIGIIERLAIFLKPELLAVTIYSSFWFFLQPPLDLAIVVLVGLGVLLSMLSVVAYFSFPEQRGRIPIKLRFKGIKGIRDSFLSDNVMNTFCLSLFFVMHVLVLTILAYPYGWAFYVDDSAIHNLDILRQAIVVIPSLPERYLIPLRVLICYALAYPLALTVRKVGAEILKKQHES